ncbi:hypothetical protein WMO13_00625 [Ignatzschineria larvae DSM 13226]|uniref:O-antigen polymerase n=1 Tax=Ignatzschineria larvae DSM 13226 TaxID=1111732 RepID=A0ABZ3C193_9GAMM|nr:hypothetical protein [Ignatzschineria larvae]
MTININKYLKKTTIIGFFTLYPGFALYNTLVAYNLFPPLLGGFFGMFSIIYLFFLLPGLILTNKKISYNQTPYVVLIISFFLLTLLIVVTNILLSFSQEVLLGSKQTIESLILLFTALLMGYYIEISKKTYRILVCIILATFLLLILFIITNNSLFFYAKKIADDNVSWAVSTYQGYARSAMMVSIMAISVPKKIKSYLLITIMSLFILFILGSRTELVGFFFASFLLLFIKFKKKGLKLFLFSFVLLLPILLVLYELIISYGINSRIFELFNLSNSTSWLARQKLQEIGIAQIIESPITGEFAGHIITTGTAGGYIHNILSAWAGFGVFVFTIYALSIIIPLLTCLKLIIKGNSSNKVNLCFAYSSMILLFSLFSDPIYSFLPGFSWGMYLSILKGNNEK